MNARAPDSRLEALERAIEADPDNVEQLRLWSNLARRSGHLIDGRTVDEWIATLAGPGWNEQYEASERIRSLGSRMLVPLMDALRHDSIEVRKFAAETLGRLGAAGREAIPALTAALEDPNPHVVERSCESLIVLGENGTELLVGLLGLAASPDQARSRRACRLLRRAAGVEAQQAAPPEIASLRIAALELSPADTQGEALALIRQVTPGQADRLERRHARLILDRLGRGDDLWNFDSSLLTARALPEAAARMAELLVEFDPDSLAFGQVARVLIASPWPGAALDAALERLAMRDFRGRSLQVLARSVRGDWDWLARVYTERRSEFEAALGELAVGASLAPPPAAGPVHEQLWAIAARSGPTGTISETRQEWVRSRIGVRLPVTHEDARALLRRRLLRPGDRP